MNSEYLSFRNDHNGHFFAFLGRRIWRLLFHQFSLSLKEIQRQLRNTRLNYTILAMLAFQLFSEKMDRHHINKDIGQWKTLNVMYEDVSNKKRYVLFCYMFFFLIDASGKTKSYKPLFEFWINYFIFIWKSQFFSLWLEGEMPWK